MSEVLSNFPGARLARVAFDFAAAQPRVVKEDEVLDPGDVGIFGTGGVMFDPQGVTVDIQQFWAGASFGYPKAGKIAVGRICYWGHCSSI